MAHAQKKRSATGPSSQDPSIRFNVKLAAGTARAETLNRPGILSAVPLFPGEDDEDLSLIYVVEIGSKDAETVVEHLEKDPQVEYVERPPVRKLVRPASR